MYSAPKVLDLLLKFGADINRTNENQQTALRMAARSGSVAVMDTLLARGLDLDARDRRDVNARDHQGATALHVASISNDLIGAEELLQYHANTAPGSDIITYPINQMKTLFLRRRGLGEPRVWKDGMTALEIAMLNKYGRITTLLKPLIPLEVVEPILMEDYLFDLFEVSSIEEAEEELERRFPRDSGSWGIG
ncbi:MAG: hypothetical protein Q9173_001336 [Seirophora scorigena]